MGDTELITRAVVTAARLRDAVHRDDAEEVARIINTLELKEARALVGGLAYGTFEGGNQPYGD